MFDGITSERISAMTSAEERQLNNLKKAFANSDAFLKEERNGARSLEELCKGVDIAKDLRSSLRNEELGRNEQRKRFVDFLYLEIPEPGEDGMRFPLFDSYRRKTKSYTPAELIYEIRCKIIHEGENLSVDEEGALHHILIDWEMQDLHLFGVFHEGTQLVCNGALLIQRLRQVLAKFITGLEPIVDADGWSQCTINPPIGSIQPRTKKSAYRLHSTRSGPK